MGDVMAEKILVVDDDAVNRELLQEFLVAEGLEVVTAPDGRSSLDAFARLKPDLVLLDVNMPFLDGFEVCRRLKHNPDTRLTPVVLVTGLSATEDRVRGIKAGADGFLSKPVDHSELLAHVRSLLSLKAYTDELERAESVLFALARTIEGKDPSTEGHCERLSAYSAQLGGRIGRDSDVSDAHRICHGTCLGHGSCGPCRSAAGNITRFSIGGIRIFSLSEFLQNLSRWGDGPYRRKHRRGAI
jgi:putative two-component system response regulator